MKYFQLKNLKNNQILFAGKYTSIVACVEDAVKKGANLSSVNLRNQNLSNGNFDNAYMPGAFFNGANLTGANLSEATLRGSVFQNASLYNTCLCYADLRCCDFQNASFGATDIAGCDISFSTFSTLSCFDLDFWHTARMDGCSYIGISGKMSRMSQNPIIVKGALNVPVIILDQEIHIGARTFPKQTFPTLLEFIEGQKSTPLIQSKR